MSVLRSQVGGRVRRRHRRGGSSPPATVRGGSARCGGCGWGVGSLAPGWVWRVGSQRDNRGYPLASAGSTGFLENSLRIIATPGVTPPLHPDSPARSLPQLLPGVVTVGRVTTASVPPAGREGRRRLP